MGTGLYEGRTLDRWQYEAISGGRIFFLVDDPPTADAGDPRARAEARSHAAG
jgi:hypothetical protein